MQKVIKLLAQQEQKQTEENRRERSRAPGRRPKEDASDDEFGPGSLDIAGALERYGLRIDIGNLPTMKVVVKCVHTAKKAIKTGAFPVVTGRLDERLVPSSQLMAPWTHGLDIEKARLQSFWMLWWSKAYAQLVLQSVTNRQLLALGQLLDWRTNINCISMSDGAPVAMKYDELCWVGHQEHL